VNPDHAVLRAPRAADLTAALGVEPWRVRLGTVPDHLPGATHHGPAHDAGPDGYLLRLPTVGRFLAHRDGSVTVEPAPGATLDDLGCFLAGPVRHACWLFEGQFALRAATVALDGRAVALVGRSTVGKSALAAALAERGFRVLADGATPVSVERDGHAVAGAVGGEVALWPDAARRLGRCPDDGELVRPGLARRRYAYAAGAPARLAAVVALERVADVGAPCRSPERGMASVATLAAHSVGRPLLAPFGCGPAHFRWLVHLAGAASVVRLRTDRHADDLDAAADVVAELLDAVAR
jgi:hypothetical protein